MINTEFLEEIWNYYDKENTVPDLLPTKYKGYLLHSGLAEYLPSAYQPYVVFSEQGSRMIQAWRKAKNSRKRKAA